MTRLVNISELCKILNLIDHKTKKPQNHIIRYWEKEFKNIKPKKINNRRYYSLQDIENIKLIKSLLKNEKLTIAGAKNILQLRTKKLDVSNNDSLKASLFRSSFKTRTKKILQKINKLKRYGKKNSS